jgi:hypothetical protein
MSRVQTHEKSTASKSSDYTKTATPPNPSANAIASIIVHRPSVPTDHAELVLLLLVAEEPLLPAVLVLLAFEPPLTTVFVPGSPNTLTEPISK